MARPEHYQQEALNFPRSEPHAAQPPTARPIDEQPRRQRPRYRTHEELTESRHREGLWAEYRFECENRERLDLPDVNLTEFADMRDWADGLLKSEDVVWPPVPDQPPYERTTTE